MSDKYIKATEIRHAILNYGKGAQANGFLTLDPVKDIEALARLVDILPAVDVKPVVHGVWTFDPLGGDWICSNCYLHSMEYGEFCTHCGADMHICKEVKDSEKI